MSIRSRAIWLPAAPAGNAFPSSHSGLPEPAVPRLFRSGSFPRVCVSSTEYLCRSFRPSLARRHRAARVSALFATSPMVSTFAEAPASASFRPRVFATPRRFTPPFGFVGLLHPTATCRVLSVQGFFPIRSRLWLSPVRCPHAVIALALTGKPAATQRRLGFEALLHESKRSSGQAVKPFLRPLPSSVFPPPSGRRLPPRSRFLEVSAHDVLDRGLFSSP